MMAAVASTCLEAETPASSCAANGPRAADAGFEKDTVILQLPQLLAQTYLRSRLSRLHASCPLVHTSPNHLLLDVPCFHLA